MAAIPGGDPGPATRRRAFRGGGLGSRSTVRRLGEGRRDGASFVGRRTGPECAVALEHPPAEATQQRSGCLAQMVGRDRRGAADAFAPHAGLAAHRSGHGEAGDGPGDHGAAMRRFEIVEQAFGQFATHMLSRRCFTLACGNDRTANPNPSPAR